MNTKPEGQNKGKGQARTVRLRRGDQEKGKEKREIDGGGQNEELGGARRRGRERKVKRREPAPKRLSLPCRRARAGGPKWASRS